MASSQRRAPTIQTLILAEEDTKDALRRALINASRIIDNPELTDVRQEIIQIKEDVAQNNEIDLVKNLYIQSSTDQVYAVVDKTIYISTKSYYKAKKKKLNRQ